MEDQDLFSLEPLPGGWSGRTFLGHVLGERSVVRIYPGDDERGPTAPEVDAAVLRLVHGLLPVAEVLEVRRADLDTGRPGVLVTSLLPGRRGDEVLPELDESGLANVGRQLGALAAKIGAMPMLRPGPFLDADLRIGDFGIDGLPDFVERRLAGLGQLRAEEIDGLREVAVEAATLLDTETRTCLVHSDLNPKNLLIDPDSLEVTGLVDWEFSHAGHPFFDLGNLLRFDREPAYADAILAAYADQRGVDADRALSLARAADLWALVDLAAKRGHNPVATRAEALLRAIARSRDPQAPEPASGA